MGAKRGPRDLPRRGGHTHHHPQKGGSQKKGKQRSSKTLPEVGGGTGCKGGVPIWGERPHAWGGGRQGSPEGGVQLGGDIRTWRL